MSQQRGLALAALLPAEDSHDPHTDGVATRDLEVVRVNALSEDLAASVATSDSGIALIYKALDALVDQFELDDAAVVIEASGLGRQVFCAGRRPLGTEDEELLV